MRKLSILQKLMLSYSLLVLGIMVLTGIFILPSELRGLDQNLEETITHTAAILSSDPEIIEGLQKGSFDSSLIDRLDSVFAASSPDIDYLVIVSADDIRRYHQDHARIGKTFTGGDEDAILNGSDPYITVRLGNVDLQKRAFHGITSSDGTTVGFIMVSASQQTIHDQQLQLIFRFLLIFCLILAVGILFAYIISRNIRKALLGFEPGTFANMYLQREEILDNLDEGIFAVDRNKHIFYQNPAAREIIHNDKASPMHSNSTPSGTDTSDSDTSAPDLTPPPSLRSLIDEAFFSGHTISGRMLEVNGFSLLVNLIPLPEPDRPDVVLLIMRDKTELTEMGEQLSGTNHVIDALRANTHEYMNKLHVISGLLQIGANEEAISYISDVSSDIENGYQNIVRQIQNRTIAALLLGKQNRAKELDIDFTLRKDSQLEAHNPYLSTKELVTLIGNLLENAFDATKNADSFRQVELFIGSDEHGLIITVDDTGCGMTEEQIQQIYKGHYTTKGEGHGFGTQLIQEIIRSHQGFLDIESEPGTGTSFTINLTNRRSGYDKDNHR